MTIVRTYLAVRSARFEEAQTRLRDRGWLVYEPAAGLSVEESHRALVVILESEGARSVALERHREVGELLQAAGIPWYLLAVDGSVQPREPARIWNVLRDPSDVGPVRRWLARALRVGPQSATKIMATVLLGTGELVVGSDQEAASRRLHELEASRGSVRGKFWLLEASLQPLSESARRSMPHGRRRALGWAILGLGSVLFLLLSSRFFGVYLVMALVLLVVVSSATLLLGTRPVARVKFEVISSMICLGLGVWLMGRMLHENASDGSGLSPVLAALFILVFGFGCYLQFKTWNVKRLLSWLIPLAIGVAASLTPAVGYLSYLSYLEGLGLPYDTLSFSTYQEVAAAAAPMVIFVVLVAAIVGIAGLMSWPFGSMGRGVDFLLVLGCVGAFVASLSWGLQAADSAARSRIDGGPQSWYAVQPVHICLSAPVPNTPIYGGDLDPARPYYLLGRSDGRMVVWRDAETYWLVPVDSVSARPVSAGATRC